ERSDQGLARCRRRARPAQPAAIGRARARHAEGSGAVAPAGERAAPHGDRQSPDDEYDQRAGVAAARAVSAEKCAARVYESRPTARILYRRTGEALVAGR